MNLKTKMLTGRDALVACSICSNEKTRALSNLADQLDGIPFPLDRPAAALAVSPEAYKALQKVVSRPVRVQVLDGRGGLMSAILGAATLLIVVSAGQWAQTEPEPGAISTVLRKIGEEQRKRTTACCRTQVEKRVRRQNKPLVREPHKQLRRRI